jgi:hypothetical protein
MGKRLKMPPEFKQFIRKCHESATCADCECGCKGADKRRGCGNFTPTAKFYGDVREKFNTACSEKQEGKAV